MSVLLVKQRISISGPPSGKLRGNICDSSSARWKARSRLPIGYNWTLAITVEALIRRNRLLLKGVGYLGLNIRLKGYVYRQHLYIYTSYGCATTLLLDVFTQRNFVADFIRLNLNFIHKNDKLAFWATLWGVRSNVRIWKRSRNRLPIRDN